MDAFIEKNSKLRSVVKMNTPIEKDEDLYFFMHKHV